MVLRPALAALSVLLLAGCATAKHAVPSTAPAGVSASQTAPSSPAPCAADRCVAEPAVSLGGGWTVRLWESPTPSATSHDANATPVLELLQDGEHAQWWQGRIGFGWASSLSCLATAKTPNCMVISAVGSHAGDAEAVLLRNGALTSPAGATVVFDSGLPTASDLNGDGWLDLMGVENDYQPSYATGHNYWTSYRFDGSTFSQTGCELLAKPAQARPSSLLSGSCPVVNPA